MTVYKNNRGKWCIDINVLDSNGRRKRVRRTATRQTRRAAEAEEREIRASLATGTYRRARQEVNLNRMLDDYLAASKGRLKASTHHGYRVIADTHLRPAWGNLPLEDITARRISRLAAKMLETKNPKTVNRMLTVLRQTLVLAIEWGELDALPRMRRLKEPKSQWRYLDRSEIALLLEQPNEDPWTPMIVVALHTGLRLGELRALNWSDIRLEVKLLEVNRAAWTDVIGVPKNGSTRTVPLNDDAVEAICGARHPGGDFLFCDSSGRLLKTHACETAIHRIASQAGLEPFGWHVLRHTFGSYVASTCGDLRVVRELLGHRDIQTTMRYAHLLPGMRRAAVDALCGNIAATPTGERKKATRRGRQ